MSTRANISDHARVIAALALVVFLGCPAYADAPKQKHFATAEEAAQALADAVKSGDPKSLLLLFGSGATSLIDSGDPVADRAAGARFVEAYNQSHKLVNADNRTTLEVGADDWPFPIPLVHDEDGWRFDDTAGEDEIVNRRIGRNELSAIQSCLAYGDAQREYYVRNPEGTSLLHYAQKFASSPGKHDGLYWEAKENEPESPLGPVFASARAEGYALKGHGDPYHGYYYRILTAQGPDAKGGAYDYVAHGKMIGGFALVAYPAKWGASGVMTFLVNHDGVVFQKDLGPKTAELAKAMKRFNPDSMWARVEAGGDVK